MSGLNELESKMRRLRELRVQRDIDKKAYEKSEEAYKTLEAEMWEEIDNSAIKGSITVDLGDGKEVRFTKSKTRYGQILDMDQALESLEQSARIDEMTTSKIVGERLNEWVKELLDSGQPLPPGIGVRERKYISQSVRKSK